MTTLADLQTGDQFLFACEVTSIVSGTVNLALYGPGSVQAATASIAPNGVMSGNLAAPPNQIPVFIVTGFAPFSVNDVVQNNTSGETMVVRWSGIDPDGIAIWSASADHRVTYAGSGWTQIGTASLLAARDDGRMKHEHVGCCYCLAVCYRLYRRARRARRSRRFLAEPEARYKQ